MIALEDWQDALTAAIDVQSPLPDAMTMPAPGVTAAIGCMSYRRSSRGARVRALQDNYPGCRRLLGEACFTGLAAAFVSRHPSRRGDLNHYGEELHLLCDEVVESQPAFAHLPWLGDFVRLEWLCHALYYRDDDVSPGLELLAAADPAVIRLHPVRRIGWMRSRWPVHDVWLAQQQPEDPVEMQIETGDWYLLVERASYQARVSVVDAALWRLLDACARGPSIAQLAACEALDVERLGDLLQHGWISMTADDGRHVV